MGKWLNRGMSSTAWVLYKVRPAPQGPPTTIDLGTNSAHLHQVSGWSFDETVGDTPAVWVDGTQATALIRLDQPTAATVSLRAVPFSYNGAPTQRLTISVNGHAAGSLDMQNGWGEYRVDVPAAFLLGGMNTIELSFAHAASPSKIMGTSDRRNLAAAVDWIRLDVK
jgi:hypothetical protein